jgi:hypothetical protein
MSKISETIESFHYNNFWGIEDFPLHNDWENEYVEISNGLKKNIFEETIENAKEQVFLSYMDIALQLIENEDVRSEEGVFDLIKKGFSFVKKLILKALHWIIEIIKRIIKKIVSIFKGKEVAKVQRLNRNGISIESVVYKKTNFLSNLFSKEDSPNYNYINPSNNLSKEELESKIIYGIDINKFPNEMKPNFLGKLEESLMKVIEIDTKLEKITDDIELEESLKIFQDPILIQMSQKMDIEEIVDTKKESTIKDITDALGIDISNLERDLRKMNELRHQLEKFVSSIEKISKDKEISENRNKQMNKLKSLLNVTVYNLSGIIKILIYMDQKMVDPEQIRKIIQKDKMCLYKRNNVKALILEVGNAPFAYQIPYNANTSNVEEYLKTLFKTSQDKYGNDTVGYDHKEFFGKLLHEATGFISVEDGVQIARYLITFNIPKVIFGFNESFYRDNENDVESINNLILHELTHLHLNHSRYIEKLQQKMIDEGKLDDSGKFTNPVDSYDYSRKLKLHEDFIEREANRGTNNKPSHYDKKGKYRQANDKTVINHYKRHGFDDDEIKAFMKNDKTRFDEAVKVRNPLRQKGVTGLKDFLKS